MTTEDVTDVQNLKLGKTEPSAGDAAESDGDSQKKERFDYDGFW
jgi:hypothetical protein